MKVNIGNTNGDKFNYELNNLTKHVAVVGTTGSGKTVMCKVLIEEALRSNIPVIAIDPKGDIASLGIANEDFDFRPFVNKTEAQRHAQQYLRNNSNAEIAKELNKINTQIFTPKSNIGKSVSLMPDLKAPEHFKDIVQDPTLIADFVEPISETLIELSEIKSNASTVQSFISQILIHNWTEQKDMSISSLIDQVQNPPFEKIGSLDLNDVLSEKDRKKVAANLNLLISSPTKKVWHVGDKLNIGEYFTPGNLSVFDLRHAHGMQEKQLVIGVILQEIYKYLIAKGGTEKLKYILYIDEVAGIFPPSPANPPTKKLLELLIRQARAFGMGILLATQNPGDIDYKVLSNMGSRFIGKLRTEQDIEKVAAGTDIPPSALKNYVSRLHTGDFIYNDSIKNQTIQMHSRWLSTYHGGPLTAQQIQWINNPETKPEVSGNLTIKVSRARNYNPTNHEIIDIQGATLDETTKKINPHVDSLKVLRSVQDSRVYKPVLQLRVEAKKWNGIEMPQVKPINYDLTKRKIRRIKDEVFIPNKMPNIKIQDINVDIKSAVESSIMKAKKQLEKNYYKSTIFNITSRKKGDVVKANEKYLLDLVKEQNKKVEDKKKRKISAIRKQIKANAAKKRALGAKHARKKTKRALTNLLTDKNLSKKTKQMSAWKRNIRTLDNRNKKLKEDINTIKKQAKKKSKKLVSKAKLKAKTHTKKIQYKAPYTHLKVNAYLLLLPEE